MKNICFVSALTLLIFCCEDNQNSLAVRFPNHALFRKLLKTLDYPLAAPSANISNKLSPVQAYDVIEEFGSKIKYFKCN